MMRLSLIGMAGTGKSYWSMQLTRRGFRRFCCDDMIAQKLAPELARPDGSAMDMGEWMGFPYQPQYKERESKYLALEVEVLTGIIERLERDAGVPDEDLVIDTTGSVVYTGEAILGKLVALTKVVHLSTPPEVRRKMLGAYLSRPGPMLWRDLFSIKPGETIDQALTRSYTRLLLTREARYRCYAHVTVDYAKRHGEDFGVDAFLAMVKYPA